MTSFFILVVSAHVIGFESLSRTTFLTFLGVVLTDFPVLLTWLGSVSSSTVTSGTFAFNCSVSCFLRFWKVVGSVALGFGGCGGAGFDWQVKKVLFLLHRVLIRVLNLVELVLILLH